MSLILKLGHARDQSILTLLLNQFHQSTLSFFMTQFGSLLQFLHLFYFQTLNFNLDRLDFLCSTEESLLFFFNSLSFFLNLNLTFFKPCFLMAYFFFPRLFVLFGNLKNLDGLVLGFKRECFRGPFGFLDNLGSLTLSRRELLLGEVLANEITDKNTNAECGTGKNNGKRSHTRK